MLSCYISLLYRYGPFPLLLFSLFFLFLVSSFFVSSCLCFFFSLVLLFLLFSFPSFFPYFFFSLFFVFSPVQQLESIQLHASDNFDELSKQKKKVRNTLDLTVSFGCWFSCFFFIFDSRAHCYHLSLSLILFPVASMLYSII